MKKFLTRSPFISNFLVKLKRTVRILLEEINYHQRLILNRRVPVVTIFGSCRQDSLYEHFNVTRIRDGLTYPHYIEETIQAAKFCSDLSYEIESPFAFRNDILNIRRRSRRSLQRDFNRTDVFVVEIASLIEYKHSEIYCHHEAINFLNAAKETREIPVILENRHKIHEVEEKLDRLFSVLPREKTVIISHIATRSNSLRSQLNDALRAYSKKNAVVFFDPSETLSIWPIEKMCELEPVISHFTQFGHKVVGGRLRELILAVYSREKNVKELVQIYPPKEMNLEVGLGDFLHGAVFLHQQAEVHRRTFSIDLTEHPISELLEKDESLHRRVTTNTPIQTLFHDDSLSKIESGEMFISNRRVKDVSPSDRDSVLRHFQKMTRECRDAITELETLHELSARNFTIFHVRVGDDEMSRKVLTRAASEDAEAHLEYQPPLQRDNNLIRDIKKIMINFPKLEPFLLLSDSFSFRDKARQNNIPTLLLEPNHFGKIESPEQGVKVIFEFNLLLSAKMIFQFSRHSWGSGFSDTAALLSEIPISRIRI